MALKVWIGGATADAQVDTVTIPEDIQPGMIVKATMGSGSITYTVPTVASAAQVASSFASLWNGSTIPEFQEIEAAAIGDGSFTLTMESASAGKPFIVSFIIGSGTNEKQTITIGNNPTGGTFTLAYEGQVTTGIAPDASAATVKAALEALSTIEVGEIDVTGADGGPWTVEFIGDLAGVNVSTIGANPDNLVVAAEEQVIDLGSPTGGTFTVQYGEDGTPSSNLAYNISAADLKTALETLSDIAVDDIAVSGSDGGPYTLAFQNNLAGTNASQIVVNGANLTGGLMDDVTIAEQTAGGGGGNEVWHMFETNGTNGFMRISGNSSVSGGTFDFSMDIGGSNVLTMTNIPYDVTAYEFQLLLDANLESIVSDNFARTILVGTGSAGHQLSEGDNFYLTVLTPLGSGALTFTADSSGLTGGAYSTLYTRSPSAGAITPSTGDWAIGVNGEYTELMSYSTTEAAIQEKIEALSSVGSGNVQIESITDGVTLSSGFRLTFIGDLGNQATGLSVGLIVSGANSISMNRYLTGAAGTAEVQRISISGSPGSGKFSLKFGTGYSQEIDYDQTASELEDILEAVSTIGTGNVTCSGGPFPDTAIDVTFTGGLGGSNADLMVKNQGAVETTQEGGEAATVNVSTVQSTIQHETTVASSGPNDWNTPENWDTGTVPVNTDDVLIPDGDNILYGLDQTGLTFTLQFTASQTEMGLPRRNDDGNIEYRARALKASFTEIIIDSNSQLINIDILDSSPVIKVLNSGSGQNTPYAVSIIGENSANTATLLVLSGNVGVADGPKEAAYLKTITQRGGQIWVGQDVGLEDVERTGGQFHADRATIDGVLTL
ncbi:hypothetical protein [Gimesia algae]|uniref:Uncharacterized protein n=1 Tax=Gimesia algae TaxID=2527971 RepID=A0A517VMX3_9PLAN|nr:hypothetical protein [Gimesia algae]QDT94260.1 hypothetical protein Pan161_59550 [Gimesia algae]